MDQNNLKRGTDYDGLGRPIRSTVTPPGGALGVLATAGYLGFGGADPAGQRITVTRYADPVNPSNIALAQGRTATTFFDELGRHRRTEISLGSDYSNDTLVLRSRTYDDMGRVEFIAAPYAASQISANPYGVRYSYSDSGTLLCSILGYSQNISTTTNPALDLFPTCYQRSFTNHVETVDVRDASSLQSGSPQEGIVTRTVRTAIGRVIERSTLQGGMRIEDATFAYDRIGHLLSMTRFHDPTNQSDPVTSSLKFDSLGDILQLSEPGAPTRFYQYSDWNEPISTNWIDGATPYTLERDYDALGRLSKKQTLDNGVVAPDTVNTYTYDVGVTPSPLPLFQDKWRRPFLQMARSISATTLSDRSTAGPSPITREGYT
jgi:hypothetical protein